MGIKDIALNVGFAESNYFIKIFKQFTGMTPKKSRKGLMIKNHFLYKNSYIIDLFA